MPADLEAGGHFLVLDRERFVGEGELADLLDHREVAVHPVDRLAHRRAEGRQVLQGGHVVLFAVVPRPGERPFRIGHDQPGDVGPLVAHHHGLGDLGLQGQHALDLLGRDIVALVVDDHVLLAVGDDDPALVVDMADVPGVEPAIDDGPRRFLGIAPVALHHQLALDQDLAIGGDLHRHARHRRADGIHLQPHLRSVATDDRAALGLAIALQQGQPHGLEEGADLGVERRPARNHRLHAAAEALADLGAQQLVDDQVDRQVGEAPAAGGDGQGAVHQVVGHAALLFHLLHDPGAQHLEQARHHHHHRGAHLLDVAGKLFQAFGIVDLSAQRDRQVLAGGMLVGMAEREERQEHLGRAARLVPGEILGEDGGCAGDVAQDRAMMLHHPARGAAGTAGVDQAGQVLALDPGDPGVDRAPRRCGIPGDQRRPFVAVGLAELGQLERFDRDQVAHRAPVEHRRQQRLGQLGARHDHRPRPGIVEDVLVIALGVGDVGGHGDQPGRHDRQIGDAPFGAVVGHQHDPVARGQAHAGQGLGQQADLVGGLAPGQRLPGAIALGEEKWLVPERIGALQEQRDQVRAGIEIGKLHVSVLVPLGDAPCVAALTA